jgi:hypothetical protein
VNHLEAALLQFAQENRQRGYGSRLDIVKQDDTASYHLQLLDGAPDDFLR